MLIEGTKRFPGFTVHKTIFMSPRLWHGLIVAWAFETSGSSVSLAGRIPAVHWLLTCDMGMALMSPP